jgi:SnoaL-like domain
MRSRAWRLPTPASTQPSSAWTYVKWGESGEKDSTCGARTQARAASWVVKRYAWSFSTRAPLPRVDEAHSPLPYYQVMESWSLLFREGGRLTVKCEDVQVYATDSMGFLTCTEVVDSGSATGRLACTNIFEKQGDEWKMVHHMATPERG